MLRRLGLVARCAGALTMRFPALPTTTLSVSLALLAACASGGGRDRPRPDGGPTGTDGGASGTDSGPRSDSGPGTDSGPGFDSGPPPPADAGGIVRDSGMTMPDSGCTSAAACSDGLACNGVERCVAGACMPGTAVTCDDGIACTRDSCVEPGTCAFSADDTMCASGSSCDPAIGCVSGCPETPCRLVSPQCGCPTGQGCFIDGTGSRLCASAGTASTGATCSGLTSCRPGNLCINIDPTGTTNICSKMCNTDADCATNELCVITLDDGMGGTLGGVTLCTRTCDPVGQTGCPTGAKCDIFRESMGSMRWLTDCSAPVGGGGQNAPCTDADDCRGGYTCVDPDGAGPRGDECLAWCRRATGAGCSTGATCLGFATPIVIGGTEYGVCD